MYFKQFILNKLWVGFFIFLYFLPNNFYFPNSAEKEIPTDNSDTSLYKFSQIWISFIEFDYLKKVFWKVF